MQREASSLLLRESEGQLNTRSHAATLTPSPRPPRVQSSFSIYEAFDLPVEMYVALCVGFLRPDLTRKPSFNLSLAKMFVPFEEDKQAD